MQVEPGLGVAMQRDATLHSMRSRFKYAKIHYFLNVGRFRAVTKCSLDIKSMCIHSC